jgi:D-amino-acid dehydrogenase
LQVIVIGAGIIGLASAWVLVNAGHEVQVIDVGQPGEGASFANGAQLSYAYVQPLADPSIWRSLPSLLLAHDSPFSLRLQMDSHQWLWGLKFLAACRSDKSRTTSLALLKLASQSRLTLDELLNTQTLDCQFQRNGKLVLLTSKPSLDAAREQMALQKTWGSDQYLLGQSECVALEPALESYRVKIEGGIYTPGECVIDSYALCQGLMRLLTAKGVRFALGQKVSAFEQHKIGARTLITKVICQQSSFACEAVVLAAGVGSYRLGKKLGLSLPVYPLKGYSITLKRCAQTAKTHAWPKISITDQARKVVFAPLIDNQRGDRLRIAGLAQLQGWNTSIGTSEVHLLLSAAQEVLPGSVASARGLMDTDGEQSLTSTYGAWAGLRPATPDGLPLIGRYPKAPANLLLNTGHGGLGLTLAFGSAQRLLHALDKIA